MTAPSKPTAAPISESLDHVEDVLADAVVDDPKTGTYRVNRRIFTDEQLFEMEMKYIFEGNWVYLAHESQIPNTGDYFTSRMGEESVVMVKDQAGKVRVFLNSCRHRGMKVCRYDEGNTRVFTCPYHGWGYGLNGALIGVPRWLIHAT